MQDVQYMRERIEHNVIHTSSLKVMGESSIEIFATNNEVMYISSRVHVSN